MWEIIAVLGALLSILGLQVLVSYLKNNPNKGEVKNDQRRQTKRTWRRYLK